MDLPTTWKTPFEEDLFTMRFRNRLAKGETIAQLLAVSHTPAGLTTMATAFDEDDVQVKLGGGSDGVDYKVTVQIQTSAGRKLEGCGILEVIDC